MERHAQAIRVKADRLQEYRDLHADVWPKVAETIRACSIRNYSIYHRDGLLFAYFEYVGSDFGADMARMAADPATQEWWDVVMPMQQPLASRGEGEWWAETEELFHQD